MSDLVGDSYYEWAFLAGTGDQYAGFLYDDTGAYAPGQVLPTAYGYYQIGAALPYGYDLGPVSGVGEGTVYVIPGRIVVDLFPSIASALPRQVRETGHRQCGPVSPPTTPASRSRRNTLGRTGVHPHQLRDHGSLGPGFRRHGCGQACSPNPARRAAGHRHRCNRLGASRGGQI